MSEPAPNIIDDAEQLARFVFFNGWLRADRTVKPDAFIPHPYDDLSVTRHIGLTEAEIWQSGQVARGNRTQPLLGRADVAAGVVRQQLLRIEPDEPPRNHAVILGWPAQKPAQKIIAQFIAAAAHYRSRE